MSTWTLLCYTIQDSTYPDSIHKYVSVKFNPSKHCIHPRIGVQFVYEERRMYGKRFVCDRQFEHEDQNVWRS
jgi:hypothetical protein